MPCRYGAERSARIGIEFVEADFEIGFNLVDIAEAEGLRGHQKHAHRALSDAEEVFQDIGKRLKAMPGSDSRHFGMLVRELRRAINLAKQHTV